MQFYLSRCVKGTTPASGLDKELLRFSLCSDALLKQRKIKRSRSKRILTQNVQWLGVGGSDLEGQAR